MIRGCRLRCSPRSCSRRPGARRPSRARDCRAARHHPRSGPSPDARVCARRASARPRCSATGSPSWVSGEPDVRAGWLSLDDGDNDLARLLTHLVAALETVGVDLEPAAVLEHLPADPTAALTALVNAVARAGEQAPGVQWVLVLDDYHVITAPDVHEAVTFLLEHLPDQLHLVIATRADPPLPLARLRSRGQLVEVRGADLRFTRDEAQQFLNQAMGLDLDAADVDALEERTEGWIAGLQLAALSLRAIPTRPEVVDFIEAFTGSNRFVIDYLADEVLARQPAEVRDFLLRTAVLDRLTGPLCDAVSGQSGGRRDAGGPRARQPVPRPAGHRALLVPLPPPVRRRAARTPARRAPRPGPAAAPAGQRLVRRPRPRRRRRPARPGGRGLHAGRLPDGGGAARPASRAAGQPAARAGSGRCRSPSYAAARCSASWPAGRG